MKQNPKYNIGEQVIWNGDGKKRVGIIDSVVWAEKHDSWWYKYVLPTNRHMDGGEANTLIQGCPEKDIIRTTTTTIMSPERPLCHCCDKCMAYAPAKI